MDIIKQIAAELSIRTEQVERTVELLDGGNTIPLSPVTARKQRVNWMKRLSAL